MPSKNKEFVTLLEFSKLLKNPPTDLEILLYHKNKEGRDKGIMASKKKSRYTLNQIGDALFEFIKTTNIRFDNLAKETTARFDKVDARIDRIDARLDYIVKANNLKDSK